jgi:hypothetical protein
MRSRPDKRNASGIRGMGRPLVDAARWAKERNRNAVRAPYPYSTCATHCIRRPDKRNASGIRGMGRPLVDAARWAKEQNRNAVYAPYPPYRTCATHRICRLDKRSASGMPLKEAG